MATWRAELLQRRQINNAFLGLAVWVQAIGTSVFAADLPKGRIPRALASYSDPIGSVLAILESRVKSDPFNLVAALIFLGAILHTFLVGRFRKKSLKIRSQNPTSPLGSVFFVLSEVEAVFAIWVFPLLFAMTWYFSWDEALHYVSEDVSYVEPMFIVVIMTIASTKPVIHFSDWLIGGLAKLGRQTVLAWWFSIMLFGCLLGSFITEPAAMTICALLLTMHFFEIGPSRALKYATLGLLFVNISVGGTLTHFAAPPVLMVAAKWGWTTPYMFEHFGWKAVIAIVLGNLVYVIGFYKEFKLLETKRKNREERSKSTLRDRHIPGWIILLHLCFLAWTVYSAHHPVLFVGGFLLFLAVKHQTSVYHDKLQLQGPLLVGLFLAGLVIHGGLQGWWIAPVLSSLAETPLLLTSVFLTSFNDNAAITYLSTLVPNFSDSLKYAVVAGAVAGGGLTVIANAPNPAGQALLSRFFPNQAIHPGGLFLGAAIPTLIVTLAFWVL